MMSLCSNCGAVVRVVGDPMEVATLVGEESGFWPNGYVCPKCDSIAVGIRDADANPEMLMGRPGEMLFELTPIDAFALYEGLGLPQDRQCNAEQLGAVLREGVVRWSLEDDRQNGRVYVKWLETSAGTRVYFGSGAYGAIVYRIRPKQRLSERVQNEPGA